MNGQWNERISELLKLLSVINNDKFAEQINAACYMIVEALSERRPVLICGNGGSSSDAMHIAGELVGRFLKERKALNVIALSSNPSVLTAWSNDYSFDDVFSRQVEAHGAEGGIVWGISTSGNSRNIINALEEGRRMGMRTIGLTGSGGGKMGEMCDLLLDVNSDFTPRIQEMHIVIYHYICECVEKIISE